MHVTSIKNIRKATQVLMSVTGHKVTVDIYGILHLPSHTSLDLRENFVGSGFFT